jgi:hypothetical protein
MTRLLWLIALPCLYWTRGPETAPSIKEAGITQVCVPADGADSWRDAARPLSVSVTPLSAEDLAKREALLVPGVVARPGLASPTRVPWVNTNGWRFRRNPAGKFTYELPSGKGALAAAEAFAYGADAVLKIAPDDLPDVGSIFTFFKEVPAITLPDVADFGVVDDASPLLGEVMNLFVRRNLLFQPEPAPQPRFPLNVKLGTKEYAAEEAADPSTLALKVRHQLTDERRTLRIFGSEVVIGRLTGDEGRMRLHLLNYGSREISGLRVRIRGAYAIGEAYVSGKGRLPLDEHAVVDGNTEISLSTITTYAIVDLKK